MKHFDLSNISLGEDGKAELRDEKLDGLIKQVQSGGGGFCPEEPCGETWANFIWCEGSQNSGCTNYIGCDSSSNQISCNNDWCDSGSNSKCTNNKSCKP